MTLPINEYISFVAERVVSVDETDHLERLKPSAILQYFQDVATAHADVLGIGYADMLAKNLVWIMSGVSAKIDRNPKIGEKIKVVTFPRKPGAAYAFRDYYIVDERENVIISGTSTWAVIDAEKRIIRRCAPHFVFDVSAYMRDPPFPPWRPNTDDYDESGFESVLSDVVRLSELDRNKHFNNARYGDVVLNAFDIDFVSERDIARFNIDFLNELRFGDRYKVSKLSAGDFSVVKGVSDRKEIFKSEIKWRKLQ